MLVTREDVIWGFRMILGREPESEEAIAAHLGLPDRPALRHALLDSAEFRRDRKSLEFDEKWVCAEVYDGEFRLWLDLHDKFVSFGCLIDNYEPLETAFIGHNLKAGQVTLDIGANIGWHTLGMARRVGESGRVIAFEPRAPTKAYLERTIRENDLGNLVTLHEFGLWDSVSHGGLAWAVGTTNPGHSHLEFDRTRAKQAIELRSLDSLGVKSVDFIKIDVEGAEYRMFRGAHQLIEKCRPLILSEIYPEQLEYISGCSARDYISFMREFGYQCRLLEAGFVGRQIEDFPAYVGRELVNAVFSVDFDLVQMDEQQAVQTP